MLAGAAALALLAGCGEYASTYRPPQDGRARVIWNGNGVFAAVPQGVVTAECRRAMDEAQERPEAYFQGYSSTRGGVRVFWVPGVYIGPPVVVHHHHGGAYPSRRMATPTTHGGGPSSLLGGGNGGGGDAGKAIAVVAAVVVLLALPAVTLGLAAGRPEPEKSVALAIDEVNAYNDLARYPGTPCSPEVTGGPQ